MSEERWTALPTTTSALENQHYLLYLAFEKKMDLISGAQCLHALAEMYEAEHSAEGKGVKSRYGTDEAKTKVKTSKRSTFVNDGRPPDTVPAGKPTKGSKSDSQPNLSTLEPHPKKQRIDIPPKVKAQSLVRAT
ncbi:hypothetical protein CF326_g7503 [Tilletia indica]|nr:hypothetical protein CF326_g7503 [Tilletia indica]